MNKKIDRFQMSEYTKENSCINVKEEGVVGGYYLKLLEDILGYSVNVPLSYKQREKFYFT